MEPAIIVEHLTYTYNNGFKAVDDISFNVPKGSIYGFLGPNGAGKSTTMRLLAGLSPDEGNHIKVFGQPISQQLPQLYHKVGSLIESPALYYHLSGYDNLKVIAIANKIPLHKIAETLDIVGLGKAKETRVKRYSLGMKQRLAIAMCLIKEPEIMLLDEPVNGLDPNGMHEIRALLMDLNKRLGLTVFISSHLLSEIEKMCTHICIINKGKIFYQGSMEGLKDNFESTPVVIEVTDASTICSLLEHSHLNPQYIDATHLSFAIEHKAAIPTLISQLVERNIPIFSVVQQGNLESWFLDITN